MHITDTLIKIRLLFTASIFALVVMLFLLSVTFRDGEISFLKASGQFLSTVGYRMQYAFALLQSGEPAPETGVARSIPVLLYHGVVTKADRFSLTEERFKEHMFALKQAGYTSISMDDFLAFERGEKQLPDKSFLLTFDDGRRDSFEQADPILHAVGFTAVMFIATDASLDRPEDHNPYYLDEEGVRKMLGTGRWELGSHAMQVGGGFVPVDMLGTEKNFLSNRKWLSGPDRLETDEEYSARVTRELATSKEIISRRFNIPIATFSYPFGDYGQQSENYSDRAEDVIERGVREHYAAAFKQVWPLDTDFSFNYPSSDPYKYRRIESDTSWSGNDLVAFLDRARAKDIPYADTLDSDGGWKHNWGSVNVSSGALRLAAADGSTGALALLDGTADWGDYYFSVETLSRRGYASLIARYADSDNMITCTFGPTSVKIDQKLHGQTTTIASSRTVATAGRLGIEVDGNRVRCTVNDAVVAISFFDASLAQGGIAARTWAESEGVAVLGIDSLSVVAADGAPIRSLPLVEARPSAVTLRTTPLDAQPTPAPTPLIPNTGTENTAAPLIGTTTSTTTPTVTSSTTPAQGIQATTTFDFRSRIREDMQRAIDAYRERMRDDKQRQKVEWKRDREKD